MSVKEIARRTIDGLPEDAGWEDVIEHITLDSAISRGLAELDAGEGISVDKVERDLKEWIKR